MSERIPLSEHVSGFGPGTSRAYVQGKCRCPACCTWARRYNKRARLDAHRGIPRTVPATPVIAHIAGLRAAGMSEWAITLAAGYRSRNSIALIETRTRVATATAARILAIPLASTDQRPGAYVDAVGGRRRLQALAALGWSIDEILTRHSIGDKTNVLRIRSGATTRIRRATHIAICQAYDALAMLPGPSQRARSFARTMAWVPPLAWDDDALDGGSSCPDSAVAAPAGGATIGDVIELIEWGERDLAVIARRLQLPQRTVHQLVRDFLAPYQAHIDPSALAGYADATGWPPDRGTARPALVLGYVVANRIADQETAA